MGEESFKKRYAFKLLTQLVGFVIGLITQAVVPRALGPRAYGDFNFLTSFFSQFVGFFDMGTSICFYTKLSAKRDDGALVGFYSILVVVVSVITLVFVVSSHGFNLYSVFWPDQHVLYIYLAAAWALFVWIVSLLTMMGDAYGLTVAAEKARMLQRLLGMLLLLLLFILDQLHLTQFFLYHYTVLCFLAITYIHIYKANGYSLGNQWISSSRNKFKVHFREFYLYSHPLFVVSALALISGIFDRWILQTAAGSIQQGFYSLSYQIGAMCFLFTGAIAPLLLREFSIAHASKDVEKMSVLFKSHFPVLYSLSAFFSCFVAVQADKVIHLFGGNSYKGAIAAVAIMAFYPIHQTYGQLTASLFYATGQTALYRNIGIFFLVLSLPLTYFLIAPHDKWGLNAGATGLAIKMVVVNVMTVNVQLYFNTKLLNLNFWRYIGHQIVNVAALLIAAIISVVLLDHVLFSDGSIITNFTLSGCIYVVLVSVMILLYPPVFGLTRADVAVALKRIAAATRWAVR